MTCEHEQCKEYQRSRQPGRELDSHVGYDADKQQYPLSGLHGLMKGAGIGARCNAPVRAEAMRQMQGTHGNRAVQRQVASGSNGPYARAGQNSAGGYGFEVGLAEDEQYLEGVRQEVVYGEGTAGSWDEKGGTQNGIKGGTGVYRTRGENGGFDLFNAGGEFSYGDNGIRAQMGASFGGYQGTHGGFDKESDTDQEIRGGLDLGLSLGGRLHYGDSDGDGLREYGGGLDLGIFSFDLKTEDPVRTLFGGPTVGSIPRGKVPRGKLKGLRPQQSQKDAASDQAKLDAANRATRDMTAIAQLALAEEKLPVVPMSLPACLR